MKNRVPDNQRANSKKKDKRVLLKTDAALQKAGRGSYDCVVRDDNKIAIVKWLDSKPIHVATTDAAVQLLGTCRRWRKQNENYIEVLQPVAIKNITSIWEALTYWMVLLANFHEGKNC